MEKQETSLFVPFALLASVAAITVRGYGKPFELTRPALEAPRESRADEEASGRRLWEDPFSGHARTLPTQVVGVAPRQSEAPRSESPSDINETVFPLCVTLPSDDTHDAQEFRRRTRYAVQAALTTKGYRPVDAESLRVLSVGDVSIPYEDFEKDATMRADGETTAADGPDSAKNRIAPADIHSSTDPVEQAKTTGDAKQHDKVLRRIRVHWIDERRMSSPGTPPGSDLLMNLCSVLGDRAALAVIGPTTSSALDCIKDSRFIGPVDENRAWPTVALYSPWATRYDDESYGEWKELPNQVPGRSASVLRTIVDDRCIAEALVEELKLRGIRAVNASAAGDGERRVLLVIERDSDFARAWHRYMVDAWASVYQLKGKDAPRFEVAYFSRSLDGLSKDGPRTANKGVEAPDGHATLDYLRRLCGELANRRIVAVGIFGQDVHDKLVVLQALRPLMREAIFFTNDVDAYFGHPDTREFTRNVIIASAFGLTPAEMPGGHRLAPFRDHYQTSAYIATCCAIDEEVLTRKKRVDQIGAVDTKAAHSHAVDAAAAGGTAGARSAVDADTTKVSAPHDSITSLPSLRGTRARVFEVGTTGLYSLSACEHQGHDHETARIAVGGSAWGQLLVASIVLGITLLVAIWASLRGADFAALRRRLLSGALLPRVFLAAAAAPIAAAVVLTWYYGLDGWGEEPFSWFDGVSVWPTEILRFFAYLLALCFGAALLARLRRDYERLEGHFASPRQLWHLELPFARVGRHVDQLLLPWKRATAGAETTQRLVRLGKWCDRKVQDWFGRPRIGIHAAAALLTAMAFFAVMQGAMALFGWPHVPARGELPRALDLVMLVCSVLGTMWLLFLVAGTNLRMASLLRRLARTELPFRPGQLQHKLHPDDEALAVRLRFLETLKDLGGDNIYGPFVVMLVMIASRWAGFDNWSWPGVLVFAITFGAVLAVVSSLAVTWAAKHYRDQAVRMIDSRLREDIDGIDDRREKFLGRLRGDFVALDKGLFAGLTGHPAVKAVFIPVSGVSGLSLLPLLG